MVVSPSSMVSVDAQVFALKSGVSACAARFDLAAWLVRLDAARLVRLGLGCSAVCCCCSYVMFHSSFVHRGGAVALANLVFAFMRYVLLVSSINDDLMWSRSNVMTFCGLAIQ
ncbi:dehydration-responsive element-binding protein 2A [Pyrus ussuriensis x Pyrus communis]|uniref:Dehydration-responsive element-binding protein 2A n=1 Tax=Pyrus ussuriensis x Pyrus communis TaxID=2448454 RepID=A0A5N5GIM4_9ROSA|nr:dehydration-responsive element-binding protein 2A [Pyrus ussuriensis x Pyrus communis]